jgi:hypothetical protein
MQILVTLSDSQKYLLNIHFLCLSSIMSEVVPPQFEGLEIFEHLVFYSSDSLIRYQLAHLGNL